MTLCAALTAGNATAEIYKLAVPSERGLDLYWWPIMPTISGWEHDEDASRKHGVNMFIPKGQTFADAPAVIYGRALYKPRMPETKSLSQLIADDRADFERSVPGVRIADCAPLRDGDGNQLLCLSFTPPEDTKPGQSSWEVVTYGEEGDFYLLFTVSANSSQGLVDARPAFDKMLGEYREQP